MSSRPEHANPVLIAALRYARADWPVFPCVPGEKIPATRHGLLDATTDPDKITWWWSRNPERNVAIATGMPGPDVLDVDVRKDGSGFAAFGRLRREGLLDGASAYVRTPSGGLHAYFTGTEQGNGRLPGHHLDFRASGGYILTPPSQIGGRPYDLLRHQEGQATLDWARVTRLLDPQPQHDWIVLLNGPRTPAAWPDGWHGCPKATATTACSGPPTAPLEAGLTDLDELAEAAREAGLEEREITRTLASARRRTDRPSDAEPPTRTTPRPAGQQREVEAS